jgi:hypothetical protein
MPIQTDIDKPGKSLSRSFVWGMLSSFVTLLVVFEILARTADQQGTLYASVDLSGILTQVPEIDQRIAYFNSRPHPVALLGDSVWGPGALTEHRVEGARAHSLAAEMRRQGEGRGLTVFSLGADGVLLSDIEALSTRLLGRGGVPRQAILLLNFRMFAPEFERGNKALSRNFLKPLLDANLANEMFPESDRTSDLSERVEETLARHWALFRTAQLLKGLWYYPTQKDFIQRTLEAVLPPQEDDDVAQAALKMKVASYYGPAPWDPRGVPFKSLELLLRKFGASGCPLLVVLTPRNPG